MWKAKVLDLTNRHNMSSILTITGDEAADTIDRFAYSPDVIENLKLSRRSIIGFIERYLSGDLSSRDLAEIMEAIDVNERISIEDVDPGLVASAVFNLTSPEINGELIDREFVLSVLNRLR